MIYLLAFAKQSQTSARSGLFAQLGGDELASIDKFVHIYTCFNPHFLAHIDYILGRHVASRTFGVGAATQPRHAAIHRGDAKLQGSQYIRERLAVSVMEVNSELVERDTALLESFQQESSSTRSTNTNGVAQRYLVTTLVQQQLRYFDDL